MTNPYLSVVVVGRNDDYGVNFLDRLNTFICSLDYQVRNYPDLIELIVVEWNPLSDRAPLTDVLPKTNNLGIRIITVPAEVHDKIGHPSPVLEYHGKNVGIRRAKGQFVLTTNPDILFTDELIEWFNQRILRVDSYYRTDRHDFNGEGIMQVPIGELVPFACSKTFLSHIITTSESTDVEIINPVALTDLPATPPDSKGIHTNGAGDFILASKEVFFTVRGLFESVEHRYHLDSYSVIRLNNNAIKQVVVTAPLCIFHQDHKRNSVDPWNVENAIKLGKTPGLTNWGLQNIELPERTNKKMEQVTVETHGQDLQYMLAKTKYGHDTTDKHQLTFFALAMSIGAKRILELGVRDGNSTLPWLLSAKELGGFVDSVDLEPTNWQCPESINPYWKFTQSDAIKFLEDCVAQGTQYDLIYIDDWHSYAHVKRELELVEHMITPSGIILLHDLMYNNSQPDYHMELTTTDAQWAEGGPYRAVKELDPEIWEWATIPSNHGMTLLRKKSQTVRTVF
jgi:predicted O-methyltransferase YrrM